MSEKVDQKIIKKTQDSLGKIIKKPPLTEKLLNKPPFRFLHDILTSVIKTTGFMKDVFTDMEMNSENIKDKESKILFLQKAIDFITFVNGSSISTNPNKVIAGHEASKTNEFLQALADAVNKKNSELKISEKVKHAKSSKVPPEKKPSSLIQNTEKKGLKQSPKNLNNYEKKLKQEVKSSKMSTNSENKMKSDKKTVLKSSNDVEEISKQSSDKILKQDKKLAISSKIDKSTKKESSNNPKENTNSNFESGLKMPSIKNDKRIKVDNEEYVNKFQKKSEKSKSSKRERPPRESSSHKNSADKDRDGTKEEKRSRKSEKEGKREEKDGKREDRDKRREDKDNRDSRKERRREEREESSVDRRDKSKRRNEDKEHKSRDDRRTSKDRGDRRSSKDHRSRNDSEKRSSRDHESRKSAHPRRKHDDDLNNNSDDELNNQRDRKKNDQRDDLESEENEAKKKNTTTTNNNNTNNNNNNKDDDEVTAAKPSADISQEEFHRQPQTAEKPAEDKPTSANRGRLARPSSARPAPPKPKKQDELNKSQTKLVTSESNKVPNLIVDKQLDTDSDTDDGLIDDEEDNFIDDSVPKNDQNNELSNGEHGGLVKGILEQKNTLEQGNLLVKQNKTQIEKNSSFNDVARNKERQIIDKQISLLRTNIQTLTRGVNPLGKIMDFVQEDLDAMRKELDVWKAENRSNEKKLMLEQGVTDESIEPLLQQLIQLDASISDEHDIIAAVKSNIIRNNERITKMIATIAVS